MPLYDYVCAFGHVKEVLEAADCTFSRWCNKHENGDEPMCRIISAPSRAVIKTGCTGAQKH